LLKDDYYGTAQSLGGLVLDHPTKNPRNYHQRKKSFSVGDMVRCKAENFSGPIRGYIRVLNQNSAVIEVENCFEKDRKIAAEKNGRAVARYKNIEKMDK
jgi:hypothetical protein